MIFSSEGSTFSSGNPGTSFINLFENPCCFITLSRSRLIVVIALVGSRGNGAGDNICHVIFFYAVRIDGKGLLVDHGVHITRGTVASEAEISQAVNNIFAFVGFDALKDMRMMSAHQISTFIDCQTSKGGLITVRDGFGFISPVENNDDELSSVCLYFGRLGHHLRP